MITECGSLESIQCEETGRVHLPDRTRHHPPSATHCTLMQYFLNFVKTAILFRLQPVIVLTRSYSPRGIQSLM
ncbi:hypothetical protein BC830DRAFT_1149098, partial [Chytriomyces sp. MP71]